MARVVVSNHLTLDGVMQAPGRPDEDRRGGFTHGGWAPPYADPVMQSHAAAGIAKGGALLFGRRTFEQFAAFWSKQPRDRPFSAVLNERRKYVASRTLKPPLGWDNATLLEGDAADAVARLKATLAEDLTILGSGELVQSLLRRGLIDELTLNIHPLVLGSGRKLFPDGGAFAKLQLVEAKPTTTGVVIAVYRPAP